MVLFIQVVGKDETSTGDDACLLLKNQTNEINSENQKTLKPHLKKAYILTCCLSLISSNE